MAAGVWPLCCPAPGLGWEADEQGHLTAQTFATKRDSGAGRARCSAFSKMFVLGLIMPAGSTSNMHVALASHWQAASQRAAMETRKCQVMT